MPSKVANAKQAVEIAKDFLTTAGLGFHVITRSEPEGKDLWAVEAETLGDTYVLRIDERTGVVKEFKKAARSK